MKKALPSVRSWSRPRRRPLRLLAEDRGDHPGGVVPAEPLEVDPLEPAGPAELGEPRQERMPAVQLVGPIGETDDDAIGGEARDQVGQREPGRRVRPVEVLDDEEDRAGRGQVLEDPEQGVEEVRLGAHAVDRDVVGRPAQGAGLRGGGRRRRQDRADRRDEGRQGAQGARSERREQLPVVRADPLPDRRRDRRVRQADAADRHAAATQDAEPALRGQPGDLTRQPRLADARLAREEEVGRIVGDAVEDVLGQPDLVGPADEDGTDASPRHSADDRRGGRSSAMDGCHPRPGVSRGPAGRGDGRAGSASRGDGAPGRPGSVGPSAGRLRATSWFPAASRRRSSRTKAIWSVVWSWYMSLAFRAAGRPDGNTMLGLSVPHIERSR